MRREVYISFALASLLLVGCGSSSSDKKSNTVMPTPTPAPTAVTSLDVPMGDKQKEIRSVDKIEINSVDYDVSFNTILKTGYTDTNGEIFGALKDKDNNLIRNEDGSVFICKSSNQGSGPDHTSIIDKDDSIYMVTQFECGIGAIYMAELNQDSQSGELTFKKGSLKYIDQSSEFGGWVHCAGMKTPWNTHLSSEEYEPDAKSQVDSSGLLTNSYYGEFLSKYWGGDYPNPYYYGWTPEIEITDDSGYNYKKHYAMGRFSHELAYVMPDKKTVYLSDDGTNVGLFMFIADREGDLSAGVLYAAKWIQQSNQNGGSATLEWINLGHSSNEAVRAVVASKANFTDFFEEVVVSEDGSCQAGFSSINTTAGHECLKIKDGVDEAVLARLETRRYASIKGATTEFRKEEGITYDEDHNKLYIAMSRIQYGMEDNMKKGKENSKYDIGGNNDVKLPYNNCGAVYASDIESGKKDRSGNAINSSYVIGNMNAMVTGEMVSYDENSKYAGNSCSVDKISEPDNVSYLAGSNILLIGEDGGYHANNVIWSYNVETKELKRVLTAPIGAETTSPFWHTDINGFGYVTAVIQHPFGELDEDDADYSIDADSHIGYVGAFKGLK